MISIPELKLPFWLGGPELEKLRKAALKWWELLAGWAMIPVNMQDPEKCTEGFLSLIAWQRDIRRFDGEPLELFRKRVTYARANAVDSGSVVGFKRIMQRLGVGEVGIQERIPGQDWDIVSILLSDVQLSENQKLLDTLIHQYGRTCRRYDWQVRTPVTLRMQAGEFNHDTLTVYAVMPPWNVSMQLQGNEFAHDEITLKAAVPPLFISVQGKEISNDTITIGAKL
ncbi:phage tail protein [Maridesulfovibrio sp.]|uniref:phage tail protein n=1 Tax=Maridesulfovibrio sp. TaxID=2795000 RepID=UPI0029CA1613|nr:phage tail protein [Maridesulfovibrio sp.]